ncbi:MAG: SIS domain-containing protein [Candidatus Binataceae bacterium]|jgi:D-sedoheptulose 7-phosphate isomerase
MKPGLADYIDTYLEEVTMVARRLSRYQIARLVDGLVELRSDNGRLFILGVGGSAANASHAVNDFRKIAGIESYTPTDNVSELTARINDDGWESCYARWLEVSHLSRHDALLVLSVGGGNAEKGISTNLIEAIKLARSAGAKVFGIAGRDGGYVARTADACVIVPLLSVATITPHAEAFQSVLWHLIVSHPALRASEMKWESISQQSGDI